MIEILEHKSSSYAPRTWANAAEADVTIALAVDYNTAGERLTHKAAGKRYLALPLDEAWIVNARKLYHRLTALGITNKATVNVAGNGIYTLVKAGWSQDEINDYIWRLLAQVHEYFHIDRIISGGQTGVDIAGGWSAVKLGIPCKLTLPKGFLQRHEDGKDRTHTREEIAAQIAASTSGAIMEQLYVR